MSKLPNQVLVGSLSTVLLLVSATGWASTNPKRSGQIGPTAHATGTANHVTNGSTVEGLSNSPMTDGDTASGRSASLSQAEEQQIAQYLASDTGFNQTLQTTVSGALADLVSNSALLSGKNLNNLPWWEQDSGWGWGGGNNLTVNQFQSYASAQYGLDQDFGNALAQVEQETRSLSGAVSAEANLSEANQSAITEFGENSQSEWQQAVNMVSDTNQQLAQQANSLNNLVSSLSGVNTQIQTISGQLAQASQTADTALAATQTNAAEISKNQAAFDHLNAQLDNASNRIIMGIRKAEATPDVEEGRKIKKKLEAANQMIQQAQTLLAPEATAEEHTRGRKLLQAAQSRVEASKINVVKSLAKADVQIAQAKKQRAALVENQRHMTAAALETAAAVNFNQAPDAHSRAILRSTARGTIANQQTVQQMMR